MRYDKFQARIQARFHWVVPEEYRLIHERGWTADRPAGKISSAPGDGYLWLPDMEWMKLEEIVDFEFPDYCQPHLLGLVPFALTGGGDHWCWNSRKPSKGGTPVLLCRNDDLMALIVAPSFAGALYRQALRFASTMGWGATAAEVKKWLHRCATDFAAIVPAAWCQTLESLSSREPVEVVELHQKHMTLLPTEERKKIEKRDLKFADLDKEVQWTDLPATE